MKSFQLGEKLKNRYLRSDAFTSSKSRFGGRSISRLGITSGKRNTFDYKMVIKIFIILIIIFSISLYLLPQFRYGLHRFFINKVSTVQTRVDEDVLSDKQYYVAPYYLKNDTFAISKKNDEVQDGNVVLTDDEKYALGVIVDGGLKLFSAADFRNDFIFKKTFTVVATTSSSSDIVTESVNSISFTGFAYGSLISEINAKTDLQVGDIMYTRTIHGLKPVATIVLIEDNVESTLKKVYAQLVYNPNTIYKVTIENDIF